MRKTAALLILLLLLGGCAADLRPGPEPRKEAESMTATANVHGFGCDVVFFGDSITADSDFTGFFPDRSIVNLGVYGDTLEDLIRRVPEVRAENPEKIFVLGGINCLRPDRVKECLAQYADLLDALKAACPRATVIVQSVLPVAAELDPDGRENDAVRRFNAALKDLAAERDLAYADLYAVYVKDGSLDPTLTRDGLHLNFTAYGPWAEVIAPLVNAEP